ncbi:MAG TPA: aspartate carbamoyltransferase catalytic subunit [Fimbriimonadaceae bacterium]|nr:aspartate carbamoyltransferase catalytic subunit [Fimbriimonadaceae bacterium]
MSRNLLGIRHLSKDQIEELLDLGKEMKTRVQSGGTLPDLSHLVMGMLFFENSTRTRVSFEMACHYLRMKTASFSGAGSSMSKGETLKDTILTLRYERLNGLVMRHKLSGAPALASRYFGGPVLNAGDGQHEHPTQALGDALTILENRGQIKGLRIAIVGDVEHSRVARSNAWLLSRMGAEVRFVGPRMLMPAHVALLPGDVFYDLPTGIEDADVIIALRLQKERMSDGLISSIGEYAKLYQVNKSTIQFAKKNCLVMHPGPLNRGVEVDDSSADGTNSVITQQIENGIFVRMAALYWVFGGGFKKERPAERTKKTAAATKPKARSKKSA